MDEDQNVDNKDQYTDKDQNCDKKDQYTDKDHTVITKINGNKSKWGMGITKSKDE